MNSEGVILDVNQAFTTNYGYGNKDIRGQNFSILFTEDDRLNMVPQIELKNVAATGQANDENYVIEKQGLTIWSLGESLLVSDAEGISYIVKDIINLQAKRHIEFFLTETEELLEKIFESSREIPMIVLDGGMKILKANGPFLTLFSIAEQPAIGSRLVDLSNLFWQSADIRREISLIIIKDLPLKNRKFILATEDGGQKILRFDSRIIESKRTPERKIFISIQEMVN